METKNINSYLTFQLNKEVFAINVGQVLNILEMSPVTEVPQAPDFMKGVINLRGNVLPVIDSKIKLHLGATEITSSTCILVLEVTVDGDDVQVGALVDAVQEVIIVDEQQILPPPSLGTKFKSDTISGMIKHHDIFVMILNVNSVFDNSVIQKDFALEALAQ